MASRSAEDMIREADIAIEKSRIRTERQSGIFRLDIAHPKIASEDLPIVYGDPQKQIFSDEN